MFSGIDTLNKAVNKLFAVREPSDWKTVLVEITISEIKTIDCSVSLLLKHLYVIHWYSHNCLWLVFVCLGKMMSIISFGEPISGIAVLRTSILIQFFRVCIMIWPLNPCEKGCWFEPTFRAVTKFYKRFLLFVIHPSWFLARRQMESWDVVTSRDRTMVASPTISSPIYWNLFVVSVWTNTSRWYSEPICQWSIHAPQCKCEIKCRLMPC